MDDLSLIADLFVFAVAGLVFFFCFFLRFLLWMFSFKVKVVCKDCGHVGLSKKKPKGSVVIEILLWFLLLVPGIIYSVWRTLNRTFYCSKCGEMRVTRADSPMGKAVINQMERDTKRSVG